MVHDFSSLLALCREQNISLAQAALRIERAASGLDDGAIYEGLRARWSVMRESASRALESPQRMAGGLIEGQSRVQHTGGGRLAGEYLNRVMAKALSCCEVNAGMGVICAAPTAGSCGILPAVLGETAEKLGCGEAALLDALLVAGVVGAIITHNATVSGAEGGCQAECGVAAAMAAAAAVFLAGGSPAQSINAVAITLMNCMGLVCDPVAGLVQLPCSYRNASQAVSAIISADMALAGQDPVIPADEVVEAMYRVGRQLPPELRETAQGGVAKTPTARRIKQTLQQDWRQSQ